MLAPRALSSPARYSPHARLVQHTNANQAANDGVTLEETLGVLLVELQQLTGSATDLREYKLWNARRYERLPSHNMRCACERQA